MRIDLLVLEAAFTPEDLFAVAEAGASAILVGWIA
jgi:hypothetical protein